MKEEYPVDKDSIVNYHEKLVFECIQRTLVETGMIDTMDAILDIACLALNRLPARYIRHQVDAVFYMTDSEMQKMLTDVDASVQKGYEIVLSNPRRSS
jgi:hypothetical protein